MSNEELMAEVKRLEHLVNYWRIEAETDHARWLRVLEENERLRKAGDALEFLVCFNYEGDINEDEHSARILDAWSAAKDGKPSE